MAEDELLKNGHYNKLGVYKILRNITKNDRPVWKHIIFDYYLFFGGMKLDFSHGFLKLDFSKH